METQPGLSKVSARKLRRELERWEKRRNDLVTAFPCLADGSASLTAQYLKPNRSHAGGPVWDEYASVNSHIERLELELIRRDQAPNPSEDAAKKEPVRNAPKPAVELTERENREKKISEVIQRGSKGRTYCRELDNANIQPRRDGVWRDAPRTYMAAYNQGRPWRHRIEDEKSKIRRKAEAEKLAGVLAGE